MSAEVRIVRGYPPVVNDVTLAKEFAEYARSNGVRVEEPQPTMGAEDFAYFAQRVPGLLIRLGVRSESVGAIHPGHSALFRIDEAALPVGVASLLLFARASEPVKSVDKHPQTCGYYIERNAAATCRI